MKATEADLAPTPSIRAEEAVWSRWSRNRAASAARTRKGFYDYPEKGKGQKSLWSGISALQAEASRSRHAGRRGTEAALPRRAGVEAARTVEDGVGGRSARGRCRLDPRHRVRAVHRRHAVLYRLHGREEISSRCCRKLEAKYGSRFTPPKLLLDMRRRARLLWPFPPKKRRRKGAAAISFCRHRGLDLRVQSSLLPRHARPCAGIHVFMATHLRRRGWPDEAAMTKENQKRYKYPAHGLDQPVAQLVALHAKAY